MKVTAAVIAQAESSRVSPDPGSTSHQDSDGSFAQTFYRSIRKSQADSASSASSPEATRGTPSGETSVAMPSAENAVAALPSESPNGLPDQVKLRGNVRPEARAGGTLYTFDRRATTGRDATPQVLEARQTVGRSGSGTPQGGAPARSALLAGAAPATAERKLTARAADDARAEAQAAAGARPDAEPTAADLPDLAAVDSPPTPPSAGQGPLPRLAEGHWSRIVPESRSTTAGGDTAGAGDSASGPPVAAEQPSLRRAATQTAALVSVPATPFPGGGTDSPQLSPTRASQAPVALFGGFGTDTPLSPPASRAPVAATPSTPTAGGARIARVFAIPTALSAPTSDGKLLAGNPAMPLDAFVPEPATPSSGGGTDSPQLSPTRASQAPVALFGGFGTDTPLSPPASRAPVAATPSTPTAGGARIARVFAIPTALSAPTSDGKLLAGNPAMPLDAFVPEPATPSSGGGTDSPQLPPTRASRAPVAPFGGFGTDTPPLPPPRASRTPVAATPSTPTAGGARIARVFAIPTALSAPTSDGKLLAGNPAMPLDAFVPEPATPSSGGGTDSPQLPPTRASRAPVAPFGGFGTDTPPLPPPRASRAHVAATPSTPTAGEPRTAHVFAARTAVPTPKSDGTRLAPTFATPLDAPVPEPATPFPGASTDSPELPPTRASQAPVAPFGGFGTDTPPLPPPRASRAHVATMPSTPTAGEPGAAQVFVARKAIPTAVAHGTHATHAPDEPSPAGAAPAQHRPASNPSDASAPIVSPPTAGPVADIASLAAQLTQPASLPPSSPSSVTPSAHSAGTASTEVPLAAAGTRSRPAKPTPAGTPVSTPTSAPPAPSKAEPSVLVAPANQSLVEPHAGAREASTEEPARAQDATDGPGPQPPASLAAFIAASNFPTPPSQTDDMGRLRPAEMASGPEHGQAPRSGKDTGDPAVPGAPLPTPAAHNQPGLRAEAQATAPLTQTQLQGTLPVHSPATNGPTSASLADPRGATHLPAHAASLAAQVARDDGLSMTVLPHAAHMAIESPDGDLALHMRVRQGSAEISVGGSMAHLFATRAPEARAALASEGLALGRFDSGQQEGGQQGQPAPETPEPAGEAPAPYRPTHGGPLPAPAEGRIHVTA